jgi:uncharacterized membrane protein YraQ (UPF0718 family)
MAWEVCWALVLGFALSGIVQAWVPRSRIERALGGRGPREVSLATGLGAASSSCSYAAIAIAKSMFEKGASFASAMVFQFASTNLVFELGIVIWVFIGWQFTLAELVGGLILIALMWLGLRLFVTRRLEEEARRHAEAADAGHVHPSHASEGLSVRQRLTSVQAWSDVAHNFRHDWTMLWREISAGFVIAGFVSLLPASVFNGLFITDAQWPVRLLENVLLGPIVAVLSFVCSVGNAPLAAVLWGGGDLVRRRDCVHLRRSAGHADRDRLHEVLRPRSDGPVGRDHVRRDRACRTRRRRNLQCGRTRADDTALDRLDHQPGNLLELHDLPEHRLSRRRGGPVRPDAPAAAEAARDRARARRSRALSDLDR